MGLGSEEDAWTKCLLKGRSVKSISQMGKMYSGSLRIWKRIIIIIIIIIIKKGRQCKAERESDIHRISPKTPAPQYQPIDRKKRKGKRVEDYSRDRAA